MTHIGILFDDDVALYIENGIQGFTMRWYERYKHHPPSAYMMALHEEYERRERRTFSFWIKAIIDFIT